MICACLCVARMEASSRSRTHLASSSSSSLCALAASRCFRCASRVLFQVPLRASLSSLSISFSVLVKTTARRSSACLRILASSSELRMTGPITGIMPKALAGNPRRAVGSTDIGGIA